MKPAHHKAMPYAVPLDCLSAPQVPPNQYIVSRSLQSFYLHTYPPCCNKATKRWMACQTEGKATAEAVPLKCGREPEEEMGGQEHSAGWWLISATSAAISGYCAPVHHLENKSAASKVKAAGMTPSRQGKNTLWKQWRCGAGRGRMGGERQKRSSMKEIPQHLQFQCKSRWQMLSQVFTAERVKLWSGGCFGWFCFWFVFATFFS